MVEKVSRAGRDGRWRGGELRVPPACWPVCPLTSRPAVEMEPARLGQQTQREQGPTLWSSWFGWLLKALRVAACWEKLEVEGVSSPLAFTLAFRRLWTTERHAEEQLSVRWRREPADGQHR